MAKNYSDQEIQSAVSQLVQSVIRRPYGTLGNRGIETSFNDIQDAAAGVFLRTPNAPFYVIFLGSKRLKEGLSSEVKKAEELIEAINSTGRSVFPITNLSPLANARAALGALESAAAARDKSFNTIQGVPAYQRFIQNTSKFLNESSTNVLVAGQIVQTPVEARLSLSRLLQDLISAHTETVRRAGLLAGAMADFEALDLGSALISGIISKVRQVLSTRVAELEALTPSDRNSVLREATLDVLAGRAVVTGFGSLLAPRTFLLVEGQGEAFTDELHAGTPASLTSLPGPYVVALGQHQLEVTADGGPVMTLEPQGSFVAVLEGTAPEPFTLYGPANPPPPNFSNSDHLVIEVSGFSSVDVTFIAASGISVETIVAAVNTAQTTQPIVAEPFFNPEKFNGVVDLSATPPTSDMDFVFNPPSAGNWLTLQVREGDKVLVDDSTSVNNGAIYTVNVSGITATTLSCTQVSGPAPANELSKVIRVGPPKRFLRIKISAGNEIQALIDKRSLRIPETTNPAHTTLGFFPNQEIRSRQTTAQEIATSINTSFAAQVNGKAQIKAAATFIEDFSLRGRSVPTDSLLLSIHRWYGQASYPAGTSVTFTVLGTTSGGIPSVLVGDTVVLRTSSVPVEINRQGIVTAVGASTFTATFVSAVVASAEETIEVGPTATLLRDDVLRVTSSVSNDGDYLVTSAVDIPFEATLDRPLTLFQDLGGLSFFFDVSKGQYGVVFSSLKGQLGSALSITGSLAAEFFTTPPATAIGFTPHIRLPVKPRDVELGDTVEFYTTQFDAPASTHAVVGLEQSLRLIEVSPSISMIPAVFDMSLEKQLPFARVRKQKKENYDSFSQRLAVWLTAPENQELYFRDLTRYINILIANTNPSAPDVGAAKAQAEALLGILTKIGAEAVSKDPNSSLEAIIEDYQVDVVSRVDTLIETFRQRGADRALQYLLSGQFSAFFGLTQEGMSYIGHAQEQLRLVQRLDLPIRKSDRKEVADRGILIASYEEPDAEFDLSDVQDETEPDFYGQFTDAEEGSAY